MVGNKMDLERDVSYEEGKEFADKHGVSYIECSARENENVEDAYITLVRLLDG